MTARHAIDLGLVGAGCLLALASCGEDRKAPGSAGTGDATVGSTTSTSGELVADSSGDPAGSTCVDDYHGNQSPAAALDLALDTTDSAFIVLGDGSAASPAEAGSDALVLCSAAPSDFFTFAAQCPGYLSVEARELDNGVPELLLYDLSVVRGGQPLEQALGSWYEFFLKPIQRRVDEGSHFVEVRLRGSDLQRYSLTVAWLPESPCSP